MGIDYQLVRGAKWKKIYYIYKGINPPGLFKEEKETTPVSYGSSPSGGDQSSDESSDRSHKYLIRHMR